MSSSQRIKQRANKTSTLPSTRSQERFMQKQKTHLTQEYQENEHEVQHLLEGISINLNLDSADSKDIELDSQSVEFFCSDNQTYTAKSADSSLTSSPNKKALELENEESYNSQVSEDSTEHDESYSIPKPTPEQTDQSASTGGGGQIQTASTFIQIDSTEEDVIVLRPGSKFVYDSQNLYKPKSTLHHNIRLETTIEKLKSTSPNTKRMLNRYYREAKATDKKLSKDIVEVVQLKSLLGEAQNELYRSFCPQEFRGIFCDATRKVVEIPSRKFVKIFFKELRFNQHPQLCEEHSLANTLEDMYEEYVNRQQAFNREGLEKKLQIERKIVNAILKRASTLSNRNSENREHCQSVGSIEQHFKNLQDHLFKVKNLRMRLYEESCLNKRLLKKILDKWLELKKLRKSQEFQCTRFKLRIKVQELDKQVILKARDTWATRFQNDLTEIYREELETYYRAKRLRQSGSNTENNTLRPKKPSLSRLSAELKEKYEESFYMPEEPRIDIERKRVSDEEFYENTVKMMDKNGSHHRKLSSFFLRIYFDNEFVAETRSYRMEPDLSLNINEAFGIYLERRLPRFIKSVLYEKVKISGACKIAKIIIPLSSANTDNNDALKMEKIEFSSKKSSMTGRILLGLQCVEERNHCNDNLTWTSSLTKRKHNFALISQQNEEESSDEELVEASHKFRSGTCTFEENLLQFCNANTLKTNIRFKLLRSRYLKNDERTRDARFVPALENELEFDYESEEEPVIETGDWMDGIDIHKHSGKKFLKSLYEAIRQQCAMLDKAIENSENLLTGDTPGSWSVLSEALITIFQPRRPLHPIRNIILKTDKPTFLDSKNNFNVVLNVVRAAGIPVRYDTEMQTEGGRKRGSGGFFFAEKYSNVRPFISLTYKDKFCRTITAEGSNPTWNECLTLQLSGSLSELRDDLIISLFDEIIESHLNDDTSAARNMDIYQRVQAKWLGEYRIPIGVILQLQKVEGIIELNVPKILLGYRRPTLDAINSTNADTNIIVEIKENVQLYYYLNVEPICELPRINTKTLECSELKEVRQHLHEWSLMIKELQPKRFVEPLVCTDEGKRVCLTRLLEPVPLPFESSEDDILDRICRFVSLLNISKYFDVCIAHRGIWLSNQVLLETTWGSAKDCGILLCNFLLTIGMKCWLVIGYSHTYGEASYVLYKNESKGLTFLEPCSGKRYVVKDVLCPLHSISYIVAPDNIFFNIQSEHRVTMMNFNLNDSSCWLPAFNKRNPAPLGGVQNLNYSFHQALDTKELTKTIERKIMKKISSWRSVRKTVWNRAFQELLLEMLREMESKVVYINSNFDDKNKYIDQLLSEYSAFKFYGFTLNFSYINLSSVSERIRSTGIHLNSHENVEFSLAVHIHAYPNNVISVWLVLLTLTPSSNM